MRRWIALLLLLAACGGQVGNDLGLAPVAEATLPFDADHVRTVAVDADDIADLDAALARSGVDLALVEDPAVDTDEALVLAVTYSACPEPQTRVVLDDGVLRFETTPIDDVTCVAPHFVVRVYAIPWDRLPDPLQVADGDRVIAELAGRRVTEDR